MKNVTIGEIRNLARSYSKSGKKWHFHILTPECQLNDKDEYALVLENTKNAEVHVCFSREPYMDAGKELVKLLHGDDVVKSEEEKKSGAPSEQVAKLLERARELNKKGKFWHHHMLFPGCKFNKHKGKWVILFEDHEKVEVIESVTEEEPKGDLQHIEGLFYSQKR